MHLTAETRLNAILDGTGAGTWEYNLDTGEIIFNERWATMLGYTLEELSPLSFGTWEKLSHPADIKSAYEALQAYPVQQRSDCRKSLADGYTSGRH